MQQMEEAQSRGHNCSQRAEGAGIPVSFCISQVMAGTAAGAFCTCWIKLLTEGKLFCR